MISGFDFEKDLLRGANARVLPVCTRMYAYVVGMLLVCTCIYPYVTCMYSHVLAWCFSHDRNNTFLVTGHSLPLNLAGGRV